MSIQEICDLPLPSHQGVARKRVGHPFGSINDICKKTIGWYWGLVKHSQFRLKKVGFRIHRPDWFMQCTLRLLGAPVFLPLGLQTGSVIWLIISLGMIWIIGDDATYEWSLEITLKHKTLDGTDHSWLWLISRLRTRWSTSHWTMWESINYYILTTTHTLPKLSMWLATTYLPSVLVEGTALSLSLVPLRHAVLIKL